MKYVVFGSGGFAKEVITYIEHDNHEVVAVVSPDHFNCISYNKKYHIVSNIEHGQFPEAQFILAVGDIDLKKKIVKNTEDRWANFIHSSSFVSPHATLGKGIVMCPYSSILGDAIVGNFVTYNVYTLTSHDNIIQDFVTYSPYSGTMGNCKIGNECFFGTNSFTIPNVTLGNKIKVSAGSMVRHSYNEECVLLGNPAKPRNKT